MDYSSAFEPAFSSSTHPPNPIHTAARSNRLLLTHPPTHLPKTTKMHSQAGREVMTVGKSWYQLKSSPTIEEIAMPTANQEQTEKTYAKTFRGWVIGRSRRFK